MTKEKIVSDKETAPRVDNRPCDDCGNENPVWFADNEVWNAAVPERVGYICPNCFIRRADSKIRTTGWKLVPELAVECTAPAPQPADLLQTIRYLLMSWSVFYAKLPDGEYDGLGEMRTALANIKDVEVRLAATPQVTPTDARIQAFWNAQAEWSRATFGSDEERDHIGPLKHLAKEAVEAQVRPSDPVEIADCLFLTFDAARRSGMTLDTLIKVAEQKLLVNKARKWSRPTSDNPVEHVREGTSEQASPTHDRCLICGSHLKEGYCGQSRCPSPWHSSAQKSRNTGISLDGGKTIQSKFKND